MTIKKFIKLYALTAFVIYATTSFADDDSLYSYDDEGKIVFKLRAFGAISDGTQKNLGAPTSGRGINNPQKIEKLINKGLGVEGATTIFFNDNIASEFGIGVGVFKTKAPYGIAYNYSDNAVPYKKKLATLVPLTVTVQYHVAPFGAISPYVGGGMHYSVAMTRSRDYKLQNSSGPVFQAGVDFIAQGDTVINVDVKKYMMESKVKYKRSFINNGLNSKLKINPVVISVGVGYKF